MNTYAMRRCRRCNAWFQPTGSKQPCCSIQCQFWSRVAISDSNSCWLWTGHVDHKGYGRVQIDGRSERAHRLAFILQQSEIPRSMLVCHTCDNRLCCNPEHLWLGKPADNVRDMFDKGRAPTREQRRFSKQELNLIYDLTVPVNTVAKQIKAARSTIQRRRKQMA